MNTRALIVTVAAAAMVIGASLLWRRAPGPQSDPPAGVLSETHPLAERPRSPRMPARQAPGSRLQAFEIRWEQLAPETRGALDEAAGPRERVAAANAMGPGLGEADIHAIYASLLRRSTLDDLPEGHHVKNELMNALTAISPPPEGLREVLTRIYRDPGQHVVIRDYALQHFIPYYQQMEAASRMEPHARDLELWLAQEVLWEGLAETGSSIAGTALLALAQLSEGRPEFDQAAIADAARQLAGSTDAGELVRITAIQVAARMDRPDVLPLAFDVAANGQSLPLRIAAVGAIAKLAAPDAIPWLTQMQEGPEPRLHLPAKRAIEEIHRRERGR